MTRILVVGRNSFLARRFAALSEFAEDCRLVSHREAFKPLVFNDIDCVINFARHPDYSGRPYGEKRDFDVQLARKLLDANVRYVMLSSRAVYSPEVAMGADEATMAVGANTYGRNKAITENNLRKLFQDRLTVLRISNVMGNEFGAGRPTFMSLALDRLKSRQEIRLDIDPSVRRDFLPDYKLVATLDAVLREPAGGTINVGSGIPTPVGDIANWLIEGYGGGRTVVTDNRIFDEFVLNVDRLRSIHGITTTSEEIASHCRSIGAQLRPSD
ncbi:MAG: NAD(P)-dependent oxidoreductase [Alphaproteobacteria bacterium]|nr:NAD(P)-dependent oxidoreductase [Alphaproteobacteria bacterium]